MPLPGSLTLPLLPVLARLHQGSVLLTIGYHQLEGKRMELKKPFAVLDRVAGSGSGSSEEGDEGTQYKVRRYLLGVRGCCCMSTNVTGNDQWCAPCCMCLSLMPQVIGVVREKILFKARPRALITKPGGQK